MEKRFNTGLVLGKFLPPHKGHLFLIDEASKQSKILYVMVCYDKKTDSIPGHLRYNFIKDYYANNKSVKIVYCEDNNPQYPHECNSLDEFYNEYWVPSVKNHVGKIDGIFTSENYGQEFAEYLGSEHVLIDIDRKTFPISGTMARNNPFGNTELMPPEISNMFSKKVAIIGPESTGKSTLAIDLAKHFNTGYVAEYGRDYAEKVNRDWKIDDFENIASEHSKRVIQNSIMGNDKILFCDTEAITTKLFSKMYLDESIQSKIINKIIDDQHFDLWLLLDVDVPWVDDGTRKFPENRKEHFDKIRNELDNKKIKYHIINGTFPERLQKSINLVQALNII